MPAQSDGRRGRDPQNPKNPEDPRRPRGSRRSSRRWGSLRGGAGVGIVAGSAALGAAATIATRAQPGEVLGGCIVVGTVAAALAVRPRAGRLIFPAPALFYLIAALIAGIVYNRSTSKTELAIGAAQWIANGFFLMALATVLAVVLTAARWHLGAHGGRRQGANDRTRDRAGRGARRDEQPPRDREDRGAPGRGEYAAPRPSRPQPGPRPQGPAGPDQRNGPYPGQHYRPYPDQRPGRPADRRPGRPDDQQPRSGPYNFSSGA